MQYPLAEKMNFCTASSPQHYKKHAQHLRSCFLTVGALQAENPDSSQMFAFAGLRKILEAFPMVPHSFLKEAWTVFAPKA